jgi:hypothetical protein
MQHLIYKIFAISTAATLFYTNDKGWSFHGLLLPGSSGRSGPGHSSLHHK